MAFRLPRQTTNKSKSTLPKRKYDPNYDPNASLPSRPTLLTIQPPLTIPNKDNPTNNDEISSPKSPFTPQHQHQNKPSFLTSVDFQDPANLNRRPTFARLNKNKTIELAFPPPFKSNIITPPPNFSITSLQALIIKELPTAEGRMVNFWKSHIKTEVFKALICDLFWWVLEFGFVDNGKYFGGIGKSKIAGSTANSDDDNAEERGRYCQTAQSSPNEDDDNTMYTSPYFLRFSRSYIMLFSSLPHSSKDYFFTHFPSILAFSTLTSLSTAYPKSRNKIDDYNFKIELIGVISEWTNGMRYTTENYENSWVVNYDISDNSNVGKMSSSAVINNNNSSSITSPNTNTNTKPRLLLSKAQTANTASSKPQTQTQQEERPITLPHTLQYSPMMTTYLSQFNNGLIDNNKLELKIGLSFKPQRPVATFYNSKTQGKADFYKSINHRNDVDMQQPQTLAHRSLQTRQTLLSLYKSNKNEHARNILETKDWEAKVCDELNAREMGLGKGEKGDFANILVIERKAKSEGGGEGRKVVSSSN